MTKSSKYGWQHYDKPVYWLLPDDGASIRCKQCEMLFSHDKVILTQIPIDDSRQVLCRECVDDDWLELATYLGLFKD